MDAELSSLEDRINTLAMLCQQLRTENAQLKLEMASLQASNMKLHDKVDMAKTRVEALLARLPVEEHD
ncbi:DUF904 domain-containing protein [Parachitinimonas caeni]|uniref:DUF904 domain-containing protein n=1 Tax=Parachitinimonas caeni TaxID=3031301 RepID=A0ABT7DU32_9NEIS|nr:DUF904 domain-containing protein [Parachitinimonas caeni]MDK2122620.1 DUF904 domain-containing protein [Parachitinimonas caeni]